MMIKMVAYLQEKQSSLRVLKNVGSDVLMQAQIPDTSTIFVDVGLGFYAEAHLPQACKILNDKERIAKQEQERDLKKVAEIEAHIQLVEEGLQAFQAFQ